MPLLAARRQGAAFRQVRTPRALPHRRRRGVGARGPREGECGVTSSERRPGGDGGRDAGERSENGCSTRGPFSADRVLARRRTRLELDRLLDSFPYPAPHELYGTTVVLERLLDAEVAH